MHYLRKMINRAPCEYTGIIKSGFPALMIIVLLAGSPVFAQTTQTFTTNGTFTVPAGVTAIVAENWGGGAGGSNRSGAAGGGGAGAYTRGTLTGLIPGAILTITVGTGGTAGNNGSQTSISSILANGGTYVNNSRLGGAGGAASVVGGNILASFAGGNGGDARISTIGSNNEGGGGGGGSATNTTVGGIGGTGTLTGGSGGTGTGNGGRGADGDGTPDAAAGLTPGGGGGGRGENTSTSKSGADGQVTLTWMCPNYNLASTSATLVCTGMASTITLNATTVGLPVGTYTVTYNLTGANTATGATAVFTVSTAGLATFNTIALLNPGVTVVTITNLVSAGCNNPISTNNTTSLTVSSVPAQPGIITGNITPCISSSQIYIVPNIPGVFYAWTFPAGWTQTGGGTTNSVNVTVGAGTGNISVTPSNACGNGTPRTLAVTTTAIPAQPSIITGSITPCMATSQIYNVTNVAGITYTWIFPAGWIQTGGGVTNSVTVTTTAQSGNIIVTPSNACGSGTAQILSVTSTTVPAQPSAISGNSNPCTGTAQTYSVANVSGVTYSWTFPAGWTQTGGGTTNSIIVTPGATTGSITVTPSNTCGIGTAVTLAVTTTTIPAQPSIITGNLNPCIGSSQSYSVTLVPGVIYAWSFPAGWLQTGGGTTNSITVTVGAGSGNISLTPSNICGNGTARILAITVITIPAQPSVITGNLSPCIGSTQTYSIINVPGVSYSWALPAGWTQTGGGLTNSITVSVGANAGNITVTPSNLCGNGTLRSQAVTVTTIPLQPGSISGPVSPCFGTTLLNYTVTNIPGVSYTWAFPAGWVITSGQGTSSILVTTGAASGIVQVSPSNACGIGTMQTLALTVQTIPLQPGPITGNTAPCQGTLPSYNIAGISGVTYTWTVPAGWVIDAGQGTATISTNVGIAGMSGNITVTAGNVCGTSTASIQAISVLSLPAQTSPITPSTPNLCQNSTQNYMVNPPPPPGVTYTWIGPAGSSILSGQGTNIIQIKYGILSGNLTITPSNICGNGPPQTMAINILNSTPAPSGPISGMVAPCIGSNQIYSVITVVGVIYSWSVPAGWVITAGQGTNSITTTAGAAAGNIQVIAGNACGGSVPRLFAVNPWSSVPVQPSPIIGNQQVCVSGTLTYSVTNIPLVTYTWSVPAGWIINSGQGTNSVVVTAGALSGNIVVVPSNLCGNGTAQTLAMSVDLAIPADPGPISGNNNPCESSIQVYSVLYQAGVTYVWTVPAGSSISAGQGSNSITLTIGATSGSIMVTPGNSCGSSTGKSMLITIKPLPVSAGLILGNLQFCEGSIQTYSVTNFAGITYTWVVPAGWVINSGQGMNSISVSTGVNSGNVQVTPANICGSGPSSLLGITVNPLPAAFVGNNKEICAGASVQIGGPSIPGHTYSWTSLPPGFTSVTSNPTVSPIVTTTYYLQETITVTGCSNLNAVTVIANQIISVSVNPSSRVQTICNGEHTNIVLSSNISGTQFSWVAALTGGSGTTFTANGTGNVISEVITNTSSFLSTVTYTITATADVCVNSTTTVVVTINPSPLVNAQSTGVCSDIPAGITLGASTNGIAVASYTITSIQSNGLTSSAGSPATGSGFAANSISDDAWTNPTLNPVNVVYTISPVSALGCAGNTFTVTVTVNPEPLVTSAANYGICSGSSTGITLTATLPGTFIWSIGAITGGITGASAGAGTAINQILTNPGNTADGTVAYIVIPKSASGPCAGDPTTLLVTVHPKPIVTNAVSAAICSGIVSNIPLTASVASNFTWTIGAISGGITGASAGNGTAIVQTLTNPSNTSAGTVQYVVTPTSQVSLCTGNPFTITVTVNPKPSVTASSSVGSVCAGTTFNLFSTSSANTPPLILSEGFNPPAYSWTRTNSSGGGTPANADWTLRGDGYITNAQTFHSNDASQFYLSDSRSQNGTTTATTLVSPVLSTAGYSSLSLSFWHYYDFNSTTGEFAKVEVSTNNGATWTQVIIYNTVDIGTPSSFQNEILNLGSAYINSTTFQFRFSYYCGSNRGRYWAIDNVSLTGTPSAIPTINWTSNPAGYTASVADPINVSQVVTTSYTASYTNPLTGCSNSASVSVTSLPLPVASITADYCAISGKIQLTATGGGTYLWSNGLTTQVIVIDIAGPYSVIVTGANGCSTTANLNVSNELVSNGTFTAGNTGFTSGYDYDPAANGLIAPESEYSVYNNAQFTHPNFWGYDHTSGTGIGNANFMIVNGAKYAPQPTVWQEILSITPNTDYYFSAWAMSLNNVAPFAKLRFEVNGVQVGTIATLTAGVDIVNNPWLIKDRFYGTWNSGAATSATLRIIDLETAAGGNDFGLDDISFGTLSPVPYSFSPSANNGTNVICEGMNVQLNANITGGMPPYHTNWTGPNGFTSTLQDPIITNISLAGQGIYYLTMHDSYGCTPQTKQFYLTVIPAPMATVNGGGNCCQYGASPLIAFTASGGTVPYTFTYSINGGSNQTITTYGINNTAIVFAPTINLGTYVYNLVSVTDITGCQRTLNSAITVVVQPLPISVISGSNPVCAGTTGNIYTGNSAMASYAWSISGNGSISGVTNAINTNITTGNTCGNPFELYLEVTDAFGCSSIAEESFMVDDNIAPVIINCPPDKIISGTNVSVILPLVYSESPVSITETQYNNEGGLATDNCKIESYTYSDTQSGISPIIVDRTFILKDKCGNVTHCIQIITIIVPPDITCSDPPSSNTNTCNAVVNPAEPFVNAGDPVTWSWVMSGATIGSGTGAIGNYTFNVGVTTITWTATNVSGSDVCTQTITVIDNQAPTFNVPADLSYCVEDIYGATYWDPTVDIMPNRPEYYLFVAGNTDLDLDLATITDNCPSGCAFEIRWRIDFADGTFLPALPATYVTGQPSTYVVNIHFPGSITANVVHHVTYQVADCHGNVSPSQTITVTVKPRPDVIKLN